jgi:hypothetical protein
VQHIALERVSSLSDLNYNLMKETSGLLQNSSRFLDLSSFCSQNSDFYSNLNVQFLG